MFDLIYLKLKGFHDKLSYTYTCLIDKYSIFFIVVYILFNISIILGLIIVKININLNSQELTFTKNSEYPALKREINSIFEQDQFNRHYVHQLVDNGYYIDIIIRSKSSENENLIDEKILNEYNYFFDQILNLNIFYNNRSYNYKDDLCARRLKKCSIEGGLLNAKSFQDNLLKHEIFYDEFDPRTLYMDSIANDGTSLNFLFGKDRVEVFNKTQRISQFGREVYITSVKYARNRFDLLYNTPEMEKLSLLWLDSFVDFMKENASKSFEYIDVAYSTSHHLDKEIESYSQIDVKYLIISIVLLILFFFAYIWFDFRTNIRYFMKCVSFESKTKDDEKDDKNGTQITSRFDFYLPFLCLLQIVFTITSTIGLLSLLHVTLTPIIMTNLLVLLTINFSQTLNLFKSASAIKKSKNSNSENTCKINILKRLTFTFQNLLIPQMYSFLTIFATYLTISFMTQFEAIRLYCICTSTVLILKFFF